MWLWTFNSENMLIQTYISVKLDSTNGPADVTRDRWDIYLRNIWFFWAKHWRMTWKAQSSNSCWYTKQEASETLLDRRGEIKSKKRYADLLIDEEHEWQRIQYLIWVWNSGRGAISLQKLDTRCFFWDSSWVSRGGKLPSTRLVRSHVAQICTNTGWR